MVKRIRSDIIRPTMFIGIDPGVSGAIAIIDKYQDVLLLSDWPGDEVAAAALVSKTAPMSVASCIRAAIEKVHAMAPAKKASPNRMFKFGTNYGIWKGIFAAFDIPFVEVRPVEWQKGVIHKAQDKKPALAAASRMFPKAEVYGPKGGGKDGRADALLIADWCRRQYL